MVKVTIRMPKKLILSPKGQKFKKELLNQVSHDGVLQMEAVTPRRTGRGASSYARRKIGDGYEIYNNTRYLPWVNDGTGLYGPRHRRIVPVHARVLHFHWKGREWFVKSVRGQKPQRFVERGVKDIVKSIDKSATIAFNKTFR